MKDSHESPFFSIVTACFNSSETINDTIQSVASQSFQNYEHIFIDGLSTDNSLEIIHDSPSQKQKIFSEKDEGIYDAMNKGIQAARGKWILILNSDDYFADHNVLNNIYLAIKNNSNVSIIYSNLKYVQKKSLKTIRIWNSKTFYTNAFLDGFVPPHPTFVVKKEIYQNFGKFDLVYKYAADFEIMFRFLETYQINSFYLDYLSVCMRTGGETNKSIKNIFKGNLEIIKILTNHYSKLPLSFYFKRFVKKLTQFKAGLGK